MLVHTTASRQIVAQACEKARGCGIAPGMSLAQARALCPTLLHAPQDSAAAQRALEALARWMMARFSPRVQMVHASADNPWAGIFLDLTGSERLFGSMPALLEKIDQALANMRVPAQLAIAPNCGAAWALTFAAGKPQVVTATMEQALAPLPVMSLRLDGLALATLHHLGIERIGQLSRLNRQELPSRLGSLPLLRLDQALGHLNEPLTPLPHFFPIEASVEFEGVVDDLEALWLAIKDLIQKVVMQLLRRGAGATRLAVTFFRPDCAPIEKVIELSKPSRQGANFFNLIRCVIETLGTTAQPRGRRPARFRLRADRSKERRIDRTGFIPGGFVGLRLAIPAWQRLGNSQIGLMQQEEQAGQEELDRLIERLRIRLGQGALVGVAPVESHVPEKAYEIKDEGGGMKDEEGSGFRVQGSAKRRVSAGNLTNGNSWAIGNSSDSSFILPPSSSPSRPLHLLPVPREALVMVRPSHDRDGAPVAFSLEGHQHRIRHAAGPQRIAGAWWTGHDKTRDYFDVEDEIGRRWWIFRVLETGKWYVHGEF